MRIQVKPRMSQSPVDAVNNLPSEVDLQEMLRDAPLMNESGSAVHSGTPPPSATVPNQGPTNQGQDAAHNPPLPQQTRPPPPNSLPSYAPMGASQKTPTSPQINSPMGVVPTASPTLSQNGAEPGKVVKTPPSKIESLRNWSISTYKCTRQTLYEKLGKTSRTVDTELEAQIEQLRDTQRKYSNLLRLARALTSHFYHVVQTQQALGESFSDLSQKSPELQEEFLYNAETQRGLTRNGETLLAALNFFVSSVNTLCNKTMEDTLLTVRLYETARVEYDAYRTDLEALSQVPPGEAANQAKLEEAQKNYNVHKAGFERLRADVVIKLKFLDENRIKVMHKQLVLFHNAVSAYFSGNQQALEATLKQFNIKLKSPNTNTSSWLEQ